MTVHPRSLLLAACLTLAACSPIYVAQAAIEEARILSRRRPIVDVIADAGTASETRRKLELVLQARDFAEHMLDLDAGDSYTTYSWVDSDTLLLVVSGSRKDRFQARTWWFPIVGRVPYKGFFDFAAAHAEADRLERDGYDAHVRPSAAFSTLGWFNDPLLNTVLRYGDVSLVNTIIHELLHNTQYLAGQAAFNESFANFVGERGAIEFFCQREGDDSDRCRLARDGWADNLAYAAFLTDLVTTLEALYDRADIDTAEKIRLRERVFADARASFTAELQPQLRTNAFRGFAARPLNNATLIGTRLYYDRLHLFEEVYQHFGQDYHRTVHAVLDAAGRNHDSPFDATAALLQGSGARRLPDVE
ncbi:aminopeptidase [soil metagenome]